jgi:hypothetical protein
MKWARIKAGVYSLLVIASLVMAAAADAGWA